MPNCFQLYRKGETEAVPLNTIDEEICAHLGVPVHDTYYCGDWYITIGFKLAMGRSFDHIIGYYDGAGLVTKGEEREYYDTLRKIAEFLNSKFSTNAWVEIGRR